MRGRAVDKHGLSVTPIEISGASYSYRALVASGLLDRVGDIIREQTGLVRLDGLKPSSLTNAGNGVLELSAATTKPRTRPGPACAVITDEQIGALFGATVVRSLEAAGIRPSLVTIPAGETSKNLEQVGNICERMLAAHLDRASFVVGLGGGVIGDISGFVAAIFQRGIPHVQVPTTLLAMVDSSIGGKTGVNTRSGKNLLGAVHQPTLVIDDVDALHNLPEREIRSGFAEIIKHAIIADADMFNEIKNYPAQGVDWLNQSTSQRWSSLVSRNIAIKAAIVAKDEHEQTGERAVLNFGHTVGHGIERAGDYEMFTHGEAISLGMVAAANISMKRAGLSGRDRDAIFDLLQRFGLPTNLPADFARERILEALQFDKKFEHGEIRFVVTPKIGSARLASDVTLEDIREAIAKL